MTYKYFTVKTWKPDKTTQIRYLRKRTLRIRTQQVVEKYKGHKNFIGKDYKECRLWLEKHGLVFGPLGYFNKTMTIRGNIHDFGQQRMAIIYPMNRLHK